MDFFTTCTSLNQNAVLLARHFQYRVEMFFKVIAIDGPLGKVKYHAIRIEFQVRGSPHVHSFLWVHDAPILNVDNTSTYVCFFLLCLFDLVEHIKLSEIFRFV